RTAAVIDAHAARRLTDIVDPGLPRRTAAAGRLTLVIDHNLSDGAVALRRARQNAAVPSAARRGQKNASERGFSLDHDKARWTLRRLAMAGSKIVGINCSRPAIHRRRHATAADARVARRTAAVDATAIREFRTGWTREPGPANAIDVELSGRAYDRGRYQRQRGPRAHARDHDIAEMAARLRIIEAIVVVDEIRRERRLVLGPQQRNR